MCAKRDGVEPFRAAVVAGGEGGGGADERVRRDRYFSLERERERELLL